MRECYQRHTADFSRKAPRKTWNFGDEPLALATKRVHGFSATVDHQSEKILELHGGGCVVASAPRQSAAMKIAFCCRLGLKHCGDCSKCFEKVRVGGPHE